MDNMNKWLTTSDAYLNYEEILHKYGYPYEKHHYETHDGYINFVLRITGPK